MADLGRGLLYDPGMSTPPAVTPPPPFDPSAPHQQRPKLRPVRAFAAEGQGPNGQKMPILGLADARQISEKVVFTVPAVQMLLPLMDGTRDLNQIVSEVGRGLTLEHLQNLVAQLDDGVLLEGPKFQAVLQKMREDYDASPVLPPASTAAFADAVLKRKNDGGDVSGADDYSEADRKQVGDLLNQWMDKALEQSQVDKTPFSALPKAIVAPHIDYARGWLNYGSIYGRLRGTPRPDRIVVLGTNHFGMGTGVVGCDKGFQTPLGLSPLAQDVLDGVKRELGGGDKAERLTANRFDHEREHSIELQILWLQHLWGPDANGGGAGGHVPVWAALVHDPAVNSGESYDGQGLGLEAFAAALKKTIENLPGTTLVVSSADLSHAGPAFGDPKPLGGQTPEADEARKKLAQHDLSMLDMVVKNKPSELIASMAWQQNPTRWCSTGNIAAALMVTEPSEVKLLNYAAAMDQQGMSFVSSAAMVMT